MSCQMMMAHLGETKAAEIVEQAVMDVIKNHMKSMEAGKMGVGTKEIGDLVVKAVSGFLRQLDGYK